MSGSLDWGEVIAAAIAGLPAFGAWIRTEMIHRKIETPSGDSIGHVVERGHEVGVANNLLLRIANGDTHAAKPEEIQKADSEPPHVPDGQ